MVGVAETEKEGKQRKKKKKEEKKMLKKKKKDKKKKKKAALKAKKKSSDSSSSSSSSDAEGGDWVEAKSDASTTSLFPSAITSSGHPSGLEREEWMSSITPSLFPCMTSGKLRGQREARKQQEKEAAMESMRLMLSQRELNPYLKEKTCSAAPSGAKNFGNESKSGDTVVGDGGRSFYLRALRRAKEMAEEQGRPLEEVAAERFGSLKKLYQLIDEANAKFQDKLDRERKERPSSSSGTPARRSERESERPRGPRAWRSPERSREEWSNSKRTSGREGERDRREEREDSSRRRSDFRRPDEEGTEGSSKERRRDLLASTSLASSSGGWRKKFEKEKREEEEKVEQKEEEKQVEIEEVVHMSEEEMNKLSAKILKAELMGRDAEVKKMKEVLESARKLHQESIGKGAMFSAAAKSSVAHRLKKPEEGESAEAVVMTRVNAKGQEVPALGGSDLRYLPASRGKRVATHGATGEGKRSKYFADDDRFSLKQMFESEKTATARSQATMLASLSGKGMETTDDLNYDMDDVMISRMSNEKVVKKAEESERRMAIQDHVRRQKSLEGCFRCFDSPKMLKHLIVSLGKHSSLCLPAQQSMVEGHCLIIPFSHAPASIQLDEEVFEEIGQFAKGVAQMFRQQEKDCVFFEMCRGLKYFPHMAIECVPLPRETGELAPIYFKKALLECETEWSSNKKVVDVKGGPSNIRRSVPQGLPYFFVNFGWTGDGFAHVIEEEEMFPANFAQEVLAGMLELEPHQWRKPKLDDFETQTKKVLTFCKSFKSFDFCQSGS